MIPNARLPIPTMVERWAQEVHAHEANIIHTTSLLAQNERVQGSLPPILTAPRQHHDHLGASISTPTGAHSCCPLLSVLQEASQLRLALEFTAFSTAQPPASAKLCAADPAYCHGVANSVPLRMGPFLSDEAICLEIIFRYIVVFLDIFYQQCDLMEDYCLAEMEIQSTPP